MMIDNQSIITLIVDFAIYPILMPILYLIHYKTYGKKQNIILKDCFKKPEKSKLWCFKWIVISIGVSNLLGRISVIIAELIKNVFSISANTSTTSSASDLFSLLINFIVIVLFAPFFEELLFRGLIFRNIQKIGTFFAIITTGIAFGLWHNNYTQTVMAMFTGIFLCYIFHKTQSIIISMLCHFINNLLSFALSSSSKILNSILQSKDVEFVIHAMFTKHTLASIVYIIAILSVILIYIFGVILFIREIIKNHNKIRIIKKSPENNMSPLKKALIFFTSPITFITYTAMLILTVISLVSKPFI